MTSQAQVIFDDGKPAFIVLPYSEYLKLSREISCKSKKSAEAEFVPFLLSDYIKNPIRLKRIEAGLTQQQLAKLMKVTQGYISRIEARSYKVSAQLMNRIKATIGKKKR